MRAARLHAPGDLRIEDVPDPVAGPGELVIEVAAALTCGTDVKSYRRGHPSVAGYPSPLGHEYAGVVVAVGESRAGAGEAARDVATNRAADVAIGDAVFVGDSAPCGACHQCARGRESLCEDLRYLLGGFAQRLLVPARIAACNVHRLPAGLGLGLAPLAEPLACAVHALDDAGPAAGDPVAILGAGSLGLMLCALCASAGARPILLDPHPERLARAAAFGAAQTLVAERGAADVERVRDATGGHGAELVVEAVGRPEAWELAVAMAAPGGTVNLFGGCAHGTDFRVPTARVHYEQVRLLGTYHHAPRYLAAALATLAVGEWPWRELCGPAIGLDQLDDALAGRLGGHAKYTVLPNG